MVLHVTAQPIKRPAGLAPSPRSRQTASWTRTQPALAANQTASWTRDMQRRPGAKRGHAGTGGGLDTVVLHVTAPVFNQLEGGQGESLVPPYARRGASGRVRDCRGTLGAAGRGEAAQGPRRGGRSGAQRRHAGIGGGRYLVVLHVTARVSGPKLATSRLGVYCHARLTVVLQTISPSQA